MLTPEELREGWRRANPQLAYMHNVKQLRRLYPETYSSATAIFAQSLNGQNGALLCMSHQHGMILALNIIGSVPLKSGFRLTRVVTPEEASIEIMLSNEREGYRLWYESIELTLAVLYAKSPMRGQRRFLQFTIAVQDIMKMLESETRRVFGFIDDPDLLRLVLLHQYWSHLLDAWCAAQAYPLPMLQGLRVMRSEGILPLWISEAQEVTALYLPAQT